MSRRGSKGVRDHEAEFVKRSGSEIPGGHIAQRASGEERASLTRRLRPWAKRALGVKV